VETEVRPDELLLAASEGDAEALEELKTLTPQMPGWIRDAYDLGRQTEDRIISLIAAKDRLSAEGVRMQAREMLQDLAGSDPSPLEGVLCRRITCNWLHVHFLEIEFSKAVKAGKDDRANMYQRWLSSAEKRLLQSVKALAQTRRLLGPNVQVNIAEKQINVTG